MNRFRKRSDAKRAVQTVDALREAQLARVNQLHQPSPLPSLPPTSDFRTSLILPDLTRRFSVLRNSAGEPIGLDELKSRLAGQRARGSEHRVSEEEEDMILEALGRLRGQGRPKPTSEDSTGDERVSAVFSENQDAGSRMSAAPSLAGGQSVRSNVTAASTTSSGIHGSSSAASFSSGKGSQAARRMSNNLFGSGKFHDHTHMRTAQSRRGVGSSTPASRTGAVKHAESNTSMSTATSSRAAGNSTSIYSDNQSFRPVTPDGSAYASSVPSSPNQSTSFPRDGGSNDALSGTMSPEILGRASLALDEVIRELEEEGDDEIVMERSPISAVPSPIHTTTTITTMSYSGSSARYQPDTSPLTPSPPTSATDDEPGMALSSDEPTAPQPDTYRSSPSPFPRVSISSPGPRLPGYIPGMPRPMTPHRDISFDSDDQTPSTTPRATSPRLPGSSSAQPPPLLAQTLASNIYRSNSTASTHGGTATPITPTASTSPLFFSRSTNGRFTPESRDRAYSNGGSTSPVPQDSTDSNRRRPTSPLSNSSPYQPLPITAVPSSSSRPGTPSNVTWLSPSAPDGPRGQVRNGLGSAPSTSGRSRSGSSASITDVVASSYETDRTVQVGLSRSTTSATPTRPLRTPDVSDPPDTLSNGYGNRLQSSTSLNGTSDYRSPSAMSSTIDPGSLTRPYRSPTPNHSLLNPVSPSVSSFTETSGYVNGSGFSSSSRRTSKQNAHSSFTLSPGHALLLSPIGNSSRSSLESAGSSYHSWDEDHKKDRLFDLFTHLDPSFTEWHDVSGQASTSQTTPNESKESQEEVVQKETGLTKNDVQAVQDKLVTVALTKAATPEGRNRAGSVRRRRPSTSQSNYSVTGAENRVASPPPQAQVQTQVAPSRPISSDQIAKASALLDSVVDSINSPRSKAMSVVPADDVAVVVQPPPEPVASSPGQRVRALADALFGSEDPDRTLLSSPTTPSAALRPESTSINIAEEVSPTSAGSSAALGNEPLHQSPSMPEIATPAITNPATLAASHVDPTLLEAEVQRRIEAATAALRKSPSSTKLDGGSTRKRISPNQISSPTLVSASTSVDTIPLPAVVPMQSRTAQPSSARFGSRFKILKGTLRAKTPIPAANEEAHSSPAEVKTPPSSQTVAYNPEQLSMREHPVISSATETGRFKISPPPVVTPPASAGPGRKGFMSRFRKQRPGEATLSADKGLMGAATAARPTTAASSVSSASRMDPPRTSTDLQMRSAPAAQGQFSQLRPLSPQSPLSQSFPEAIPEDTIPPASAPLPRTHDSNDEAALKQLYDAAVNLGLDQEALHDLVVRSPSTTSRTTTWSKLTRTNSVAARRRTQQTDSQAPQSPVFSEGRSSITEGRPSFADTRPSISESRPSISERRPSISDARPSFSDGRPSTEAVLPGPSAEVRQLTIRKHADSSSASRSTPQPNADPRRTIVRRTIIMPSDSKAPAMDFQEMLRRQSTSQRRRSAGAGSISSNRSLQDRAPTPPPPRSSTSRRFSTDRTPPVPSLPPSFTAQAGALHLPVQVEKSSSTYESLYDMYSGDSRAVGTANTDLTSPSTQADDAVPESGPALEVIEYANGETIWSIVNGLRDDDTESLFDNRASFASDYSGEGVKLFFKEHGRKSSKGSNTSFLSRKKPPIPAAQRPETKVFFSSSGQIARLIENMSRDVDAGSFNITPDRAHGHPGHSASSSLDMRWTLEERLEHMLGTVSSNP